MNILETMGMSLISLSSNKTRSALAMLGVIIGVFSVVSLISLGIGLQNHIIDQFEGLGTDLIFVSPGKVDFNDDPTKFLSRNKLIEKHTDLIETHAFEYIKAISPSVRLGQVAIYKNKSFSTTIIGVSYEADEILNFEIDKGRFFNRVEQKSESKVIVIGPQVRNELFLSGECLGKKIKLGGETFEIIGSFREKGDRFDDAVLVPYTTVLKVFEVENFSSIVMKLSDGDKMDLAMKMVESALLRDLNEDDFTVLSQSDLITSIENIMRILTMGLAAIAGISLLVGGVGIMNIMLVSVTERTREVGLRKALGATSTNIGLQFLIEAVFISVSGGIVGLILGIITSFIARSFIRTEVPLKSIILAFGFSALVGVVFGTYPAVKASKKDPIEALRYE